MIKKSAEPSSSGSSILGAYKAHVDSLKRFVSKLLSNHRSDVDDVIQEALLLACKAERDKPIEYPKPFLFRVARNVALDNLRQKTRRPTDYLEEHDVPESQLMGWTLEEEIMAQQKLELHCAAVASLPPKCRKVYLMRKVHCMSYKEIAETLGIAVSTVETHLEKAFRCCSAYVETHLQGGEVKQNPLERKRIS